MKERVSFPDHIGEWLRQRGPAKRRYGPQPLLALYQRSTQAGIWRGWNGVIALFYDPLLCAAACKSRSLMESHKRLHFKTFVMILIMIIAGPLGNVMLGKGMKNVGTTAITSAPDLAHVVARVFTTSSIWLGVASLLTFFVANILVL